jgi:hypothetical protein
MFKHKAWSDHQNSFNALQKFCHSNGGSAGQIVRIVFRFLNNFEIGGNCYGGIGGHIIQIIK